MKILHFFSNKNDHRCTDVLEVDLSWILCVLVSHSATNWKWVSWWSLLKAGTNCSELFQFIIPTHIKSENSEEMQSSLCRISIAHCSSGLLIIYFIIHFSNLSWMYVVYVINTLDNVSLAKLQMLFGLCSVCVFKTQDCFILSWRKFVSDTREFWQFAAAAQYWDRCSNSYSEWKVSVSTVMSSR